MNADKRRTVADCKQIAVVGLACEKISSELFSDTNSPGLAAATSSTLMLVVYLNAYSPSIALLGETRQAWLLVLMACAVCVLAWGPFPKNMFTEIIASMAPFFIDIELTSAFTCAVPLFASILGKCVIAGVLVGLILGAGASLSDYRVVSARWPLIAAARNLASSAGICLAISAALATGMFIAGIATGYHGDLTYFEEQYLFSAIEIGLSSGGELRA